MKSPAIKASGRAALPAQEQPVFMRAEWLHLAMLNDEVDPKLLLPGRRRAPSPICFSISPW